MNQSKLLAKARSEGGASKAGKHGRFRLYLPAIRVLRKKNFTWREIAKWLEKNSDLVIVAPAALYQYAKKQGIK